MRCLCLLNDGSQERQPNATGVTLRMLFADFHEKGILCRLNSDFRFKGSFASALKFCWKEASSRRDDFGTRPNRRPCADKDDMMTRVAVMKGEIDLNDPVSLMQMACKELGKHMLFRGCTEHREAKWCEFEWGVCQDGPDMGKDCVQFNNTAGDKTHHLSLENDVARDDVVKQRHMRNPNDPLCLCGLLQKLRAMCPPDQKHVCCRPAGQKLLRQCRRSGCTDWRFNPKVRCSETTIGDFTKISLSSQAFRIGNVSRITVGVSTALQS